MVLFRPYAVFKVLLWSDYYDTGPNYQSESPVSCINICTQSGIVRVNEHELADQQRLRLSRGELPPFSERGSTVLFEDITAVEVAVYWRCLCGSFLLT